MSGDDFSPPALSNGAVVDGRFEIIEKLGEGGMGAIFKARQLSMDRMVALKVLLHDQRGDPISVERFRHEAYLASRLKHPNAIVIHDFGQSGDGLLYIAMEFLAGENLKARLKRTGPMTAETAVRVMAQTLRTIAEAHRMGMVHRDLKPENIFLTEVEGDPDFVKVLDFGIAKLTAVSDGVDGYQGGLTVAGKIYGTPNYMSPEQIRGKVVDQQSDLYSLGVIFYEVITGVMPFVAQTPVDVMMMHLRDSPASIRESRPDIPAELEAVVMRGLEKDRRNRYRTADEFLEALDNYKFNSGYYSGGPGEQRSGEFRRSSGPVSPPQGVGLVQGRSGGHSGPQVSARLPSGPRTPVPRPAPVPTPVPVPSPVAMPTPVPAKAIPRPLPPPPRPVPAPPDPSTEDITMHEPDGLGDIADDLMEERTMLEAPEELEFEERTMLETDLEEPSTSVSQSPGRQSPPEDDGDESEEFTMLELDEGELEELGEGARTSLDPEARRARATLMGPPGGVPGKSQPAPQRAANAAAQAERAQKATLLGQPVAPPTANARQPVAAEAPMPAQVPMPAEALQAEGPRKANRAEEGKRGTGPMPSLAPPPARPKPKKGGGLVWVAVASLVLLAAGAAAVIYIDPFGSGTSSEGGGEPTELPPAPVARTLVIDGDTEGLDVFDMTSGKFLGTSPGEFVLEGEAAPENKLQLLAGRRRFTASVPAVEGSATRWVFVQVPDKKKKLTDLATTLVVSKPAGAEITVDGKAIGKTPVALLAAPGGKVAVAAALNGQTREQEAEITAGGQVKFEF